MILTKDEIIQNCGKQCMHCTRNTKLPYNYEWTCFTYGYKVLNCKSKHTEDQRKKNFIDRLKYAETKKLYLYWCI